MKRDRFFIMVLGMAISCSLVAQNPSAGQMRDAQNSTANSPTGYNNPNSNHPTTPPPPPRSKAQPQAKSQEEFNAYQTAVTKPDPAAVETAADQFARKYPDSELLVALYSGLMQKYQNINNSDKVLEMGHKVLRIDPENIPALAMTAYVISESTRETDLDRDQKYAEGLKDSQMVVKNIDTALIVPPTVTPEQLAGFKKFLLSMADSSMGYIELKQKNYPASEEHFKAAIDTYKGTDGDPMVFLRLAIAQDNQKKYVEASANADKAIQMAESQKNDGVASLAKNEKDRLSKLSAGASPAPKASPTPKQ